MDTSKVHIEYLLQDCPADVCKNVPRINGKAISAKEHIHPVDPLFQHCSGIKHFPRPPYIAELVCKNREYLLHQHALDRFSERSPDSDMIKRMKLRPDSMRDYLIMLYKIFSGAQEVHRRNDEDFKIKHGIKAHYYANHGWIFVVEIPGVIKTCYTRKLQYFGKIPDKKQSD